MLFQSSLSRVHKLPLELALALRPFHRHLNRRSQSVGTHTKEEGHTTPCFRQTKNPAEAGDGCMKQSDEMQLEFK